MTLGELIDWCSNNDVKEDTPIFVETGRDVFMETSHCVADPTALILYQKWEEEIKYDSKGTEDDSESV